MSFKKDVYEKLKTDEQWKIEMKLSAKNDFQNIKDAITECALVGRYTTREKGTLIEADVLSSIDKFSRHTAGRTQRRSGLFGNHITWEVNVSTVFVEKELVEVYLTELRRLTKEEDISFQMIAKLKGDKGEEFSYPVPGTFRFEAYAMMGRPVKIYIRAKIVV